MQNSASLTAVFFAATSSRIDCCSSLARLRLSRVLAELGRSADSNNHPLRADAFFKALRSTWLRFEAGHRRTTRGLHTVYLPTGDFVPGTQEPRFLKLVLLVLPRGGRFAWRLLSARLSDAAGQGLAWCDVPWTVAHATLVIPALERLVGAKVDRRSFFSQLVFGCEAALAAGDDFCEVDVDSFTLRLEPDPEMEGLHRAVIFLPDDTCVTVEKAMADRLQPVDEAKFRYQLGQLIRLADRTRLTVGSFDAKTREHILVENANRFPARLRDAASGELLDPALVLQSIVDSVNAAIKKGDYDRVYAKFPSHDESFKGTVHPQIAVPITLPGAPSSVPELYVVLRRGRDAFGAEILKAPTIITPAMLAVDLRVMSQIRHTWNEVVTSFEEVA